MKEEFRDLKYYIETWGCPLVEVKKCCKMCFFLGLRVV